MSWQTDIVQLPDKLKYLMTSGQISDVTIVAGKGENQKLFHLHRFMLSIYSDVFETLFYCSDPTKEEVKLAEDDPKAFELLTSYIYTNKLSPDNARQAISAYFLAFKYEILPMKEICIDYLSYNVTNDSVVHIYEMAVLMEEYTLRFLCLKHVEDYGEDVFASDGFMEAHFSTLLGIFRETDIANNSEMLKYNAMISWGEKECERTGAILNDSNVRKAVQPLLFEIDFVSMNLHDFVKGPGRRNVLTEREQLLIIKKIVEPENIILPKMFWAD